jgi:hypothetical protein
MGDFILRKHQKGVKEMSTTSLIHTTSVRLNGLMTMVAALQTKLTQLETCVVTSLNQIPAQDSSDIESRILGLETMAQDLYKRRMTDLQTIKTTFADDLHALRTELDGLKHGNDLDGIRADVDGLKAREGNFSDGQKEWLEAEIGNLRNAVLEDLNVWKKDIIDYISSTTDERIAVLEKALANLSQVPQLDNCSPGEQL